MVRRFLIMSTALAAMLVAVPATAQDGGRRGGGDVDRSEARAQAQQQRAERQQQRSEARVERQQQRAQAPQQQATPQRSAPDGGWRSQRAEGGQRYGRNWDNGGTVSRPAPAWRGATPATPDRGAVEAQAQASQRWGERNRTYSDPNRTRTYRNGETRTGDWGNRSADRQTTYRDGSRDGRTADSWRDRTSQRDAYRSGYRSGSNDYRSGSRDTRRWNHNDWRRDSRYNWRDWRTHNRSLFSIGRYYSPYRNYSYRRLSIGIFLDNGFYGNRYWINDPWQYRLPEAYGPYRWVRYYDDALLVDIYSGEVVDVIYDFFW